MNNSEFCQDDKIGFHGESSFVPSENIVHTNCVTGKFWKEFGWKFAYEYFRWCEVIQRAKLLRTEHTSSAGRAARSSETVSQEIIEAK